MSNINKYLHLIVGVLIEALAFTLFLQPNSLAATDVSGLALIFNKLFNINISIFVLICNVLLIFVSYVCLGKEKTLKTILGSFLLPLFIFLTGGISNIIKFDGVDTLILALMGGILSGIGNGLVFKAGYTSGGTDIVEEVYCKYYKMTLGKSILIVDGFVVALGGFVFGIEKMIYAMLALFMMSLFSNKKLIGVDEDKLILITTKKKKLVTKYIIDNYHYGVTILDGVGRYSKKASDFIMCSVASRNYYKIKTDIKELEPDSFMVVLNSYETKYINKEERKRRRKQ